MAYQTGTSTGVTDLLDRLRIFVLANGWTINRWEAITDGYWLSIARGNLYFNFASNTLAGPSSDPGHYINMRGATGYSAGSAWDAQPGTQPLDSSVNNMTGPYTAYHFFLGVDYIHVVVEISAGVFKHFIVGELDKAGTYTGGAYVQAMAWYYLSQNYTNYPGSNYHTYLFDQSSSGFVGVNYVRADIDAKTDNWFICQPGGTPGTRAYGVVRTNGLLHILQDRAPATFNGITPLLPLIVALERPSSYYSTAGTVKDMRYVNMAGLTPGQQITLGSDEWLCFPAHQKTAVWDVYNSTIPSSGEYGYAYRKVI